MSRTYVVTGSAQGIGQATRMVLEADGHRVVGVDLNNAEIELDLAEPAQRATLAERVAQATGGAIDAIIAVAGVAASAPVGVAVNFFGARDVLLGLRPLLLRSPAPRAVVVSSISVVHPHEPELTETLRRGDEAAAMDIARRLVADGRGGYIYTSSKRAIAEWVRAAAIMPEWAGAGIALNTVAPGTVVTRLTSPHLATPEGREMLAERVPMPLNGPAPPDAAARLLAWLAGPVNSHVTGQTIFIDGGAEAALRGPEVFGRGAEYDQR